MQWEPDPAAGLRGPSKNPEASESSSRRIKLYDLSFNKITPIAVCVENKENKGRAGKGEP